MRYIEIELVWMNSRAIYCNILRSFSLEIWWSDILSYIEIKLFKLDIWRSNMLQNIEIKLFKLDIYRGACNEIVLMIVLQTGLMEKRYIAIVGINPLFGPT